MDCSGVLPTTQFFYRKCLGTCDALSCVSHTLESALESGLEARNIQIDFSVAFDRVNHQGIFYRLCSVGIGGSVLSILTISVKPSLVQSTVYSDVAVLSSFTTDFNLTLIPIWCFCAK